MSVQVGALCYATPVDAGAPSCAAWQPISTLNGSMLTTVSCSGIRPADGALLMTRSVVDTATTNEPTLTGFVQVLDYPPCVQDEYRTYVNALLGPILAVVVVCWALWRINSYLGWGRADAS